MPDAFDHARSIAVTLLNPIPIRTQEAIRAQAELAVKTTQWAGIGEVDVEALVAQLEHEAGIIAPDATMMADPQGHEEWLPDKRGGMKWQFWNRYKTYLEQAKAFPGPVVGSLDKLTDEILGKMEDPGRQAPWDCRGMVVGSVQSGKTANYCGLICKALDAGYRLVVVLAGMHDNLRSQTQYRIDEGVLGRDSQKDRHLDQANSLIGVGRLFGDLLTVHTLTSSLNDGDFQARRADTGVMLGGDPVILVVKKNKSILKNLLSWVLHVRGEDTSDGKGRKVRNIPLLVIDDEADNASINTKGRKKEKIDENDVTAINGSIRQLLDAFDKSSYVGYTATPFANIFINPEAESPKHGEDLFPRSFILNVSPPSNYVSPARVFGLDGDPDSGIDPREQLPLFRPVDDYESIFPPKHKKDLPVEQLPDSLRHALHCFVLACAARRARGQTSVHNSMLVHVTRFVNVQHQVAQLVQQQIDAIRRKLAIGEGARTNGLLTELEEIWRTEFEPITARICEMIPDEPLQVVTWPQVEAELREAAGRIEVREINGNATDALDYINHKQGFSVVGVGGDKLSRGLTLEGLSISYFLRSSQMYDTLMQMGRWFGYREGYLDLCRLFSTDELRYWYRHIALAEVELRREFDRMKAAGLTPRRYGLRVREHPGGLLVTAMNKMAHAQTQHLSYAGQLVQTVHFETNVKVVRDNATVVDRFLESLGGSGRAKVAAPDSSAATAWLWEDVSASRLLDELLQNFRVASEGWRLQKPELMQFIRRQADAGELTHWTVALVNTRGDEGTFNIAGCPAGKAARTPENGTWATGSVPPIYVAPNANIQSPNHQALDLARMTMDRLLLDRLLAKRIVADGGVLFGEQEADILRRCCARGASLAIAAEEITKCRGNGVTKDGRSTSKINGTVARQLRPETHGLLLIYPVVPKNLWPDTEAPFMGLAFCFPSSHSARAVNYKVNKVWQSTFHDEDYVDE